MTMNQLPQLLQRLQLVGDHMATSQSSQGPIPHLGLQGTSQLERQGYASALSDTLFVTVMQRLDALAAAVERLEGSMAEHVGLLRSVDVRLDGLERHMKTAYLPPRALTHD